MQKTTSYRFLFMLTLSFGGVLHAFFFDAQEKKDHRSVIHLDATSTEVYFNDGDTFRVTNGPLKGSRVRITGYNSLESYGPVHQWGSFSEDELYQNALEATRYARQGGWHCITEGGKDTYGRLLAHCDDLAKGLLKEGLAHAYSMDETPASSEYLIEQKKAQRAEMGMWAKGIPEYIITSLHSIDENNLSLKNNAKKTYNRLIASVDGHSKKRYHENAYSTCEKVCLEEASCMTFVPFANRYGENRARCLK